ncbi:MAG: ThiF family adenylyltransferase [Pyrinomonadaceae bacterium]
MSRRLIDLNNDLKRLDDDGYDVDVVAEDQVLVIDNVPYVNSSSELKFGTLISKLELAGDETIRPTDHVAYFIGEHPCYADGQKITGIENNSVPPDLIPEHKINFTFSAHPNLPEEQYRDYHHKMVNYILIISSPAKELDPDLDAKVLPRTEFSQEQSVFKYPETSSTRAEIRSANEKLKLNSVAIVGVGGTGSYILDFVAKTPVKEIHIFDGDRFLNHNAFRSPGAPSLEQLKQKFTKAEYFNEVYSRIRWGIEVHDYPINESNVLELRDMQFVFLCIDRTDQKKIIIDRLHEWGVAYVDVGMGMHLTEDKSLRGHVRTTLSTSEKNDHIASTILLGAADVRNDYSHNIQIAELNALNASLAVIKWKKSIGYYSDTAGEFHSVYTVAGNFFINEHQNEV